MRLQASSLQKLRGTSAYRWAVCPCARGFLVCPCARVPVSPCARRAVRRPISTCSHTTCSHTTCPHTHTHNLLTQLTHNLSTHNLLTHNLSSHNLSSHAHTQLVITPLTQIVITPLALTSTFTLRGRCGTSWHLDDMQAWHFVTSTFTLCGRHGTWRHRLLLCVAGVALMALGWLWRHAWSSGGTVAPRRFAWQAWHFVTSTFTLRGWRGTSWHPPSLCVVRMALRDMHLHFVWQAWHWTTSIVSLRGMRATYGTGLALAACLVIRWRRGAAAFCVASVALRDIHLHFVWQAWDLTTSIVTLRGRCGTYGTGLALAARLVIRWRRGAAAFWQAWHFVTSTFTLCRRCGTYGTGLALAARLVIRRRRGAAAFCAKGVALRDIHLHFAWSAWHFVTSTFTLRGPRGASWHAPSLCVVGVALRDVHLHFVWQAWDLTTWIVTLRGRCGTYGTGFALAARLVIRWRRGAAAAWQAWQAWHFVTSTFTLRGRRGTSWHPPSLCVFGVALRDIHLHFT